MSIYRFIKNEQITDTTFYEQLRSGASVGSDRDIGFLTGQVDLRLRQFEAQCRTLLTDCMGNLINDPESVVESTYASLKRIKQKELENIPWLAKYLDGIIMDYHEIAAFDPINDQPLTKEEIYAAEAPTPKEKWVRTSRSLRLCLAQLPDEICNKASFSIIHDVVATLSEMEGIAIGAVKDAPTLADSTEIPLPAELANFLHEPPHLRDLQATLSIDSLSPDAIERIQTTDTISLHDLRVILGNLQRLKKGVLVKLPDAVRGELNQLYEIAETTLDRPAAKVSSRGDHTTLIGELAQIKRFSLSLIRDIEAVSTAGYLTKSLTHLISVVEAEKATLKDVSLRSGKVADRIRRDSIIVQLRCLYLMLTGDSSAFTSPKYPKHNDQLQGRFPFLV